jgi:hypothetical protein
VAEEQIDSRSEIGNDGWQQRYVGKTLVKRGALTTTFHQDRLTPGPASGLGIGYGIADKNRAVKGKAKLLGRLYQ